MRIKGICKSEVGKLKDASYILLAGTWHFLFFSVFSWLNYDVFVSVFCMFLCVCVRAWLRVDLWLCVCLPPLYVPPRAAVYLSVCVWIVLRLCGSDLCFKIVLWNIFKCFCWMLYYQLSVKMCFCGTEVSPFWLKVLFHSRGTDWPPHLHFGSASVLLALIFPAHSFRILGFWCELLLELCFVLKWKVQNNRFTDVFTFSAGEMCGISSRLEHWNDPIFFIIL